MEQMTRNGTTLIASRTMTIVCIDGMILFYDGFKTATTALNIFRCFDLLSDALGCSMLAGELQIRRIG